MSNKINDNEYLKIYIEPCKDGTMDTIRIKHEDFDSEYYPVAGGKLGFSDGTLIDYDYSKELKDRLVVLKKGKSFINTSKLKDERKVFILRASDIEWNLFEGSEE